jgi:hypothetical protein
MGGPCQVPAGGTNGMLFQASASPAGSPPRCRGSGQYCPSPRGPPLVVKGVSSAQTMLCRTSGSWLPRQKPLPAEAW